LERKLKGKFGVFILKEKNGRGWDYMSGGG
jgi:hypothetical protein